MTTRSEVVAEARTWLGTPFHHQGRIKGVAADCAGVIEGVARHFGFVTVGQIPANYSHQPDGGTMRKVLRETMDEISVADILPADVLLFAFDLDPQHVAMVTDLGILHSYSQVKRCIETSLDQTWRNRIRGAYRFRGIE